MENTKSNCGAWHCGKQDVHYSILNGNFVYWCNVCQKWVNSKDLSIKKV